MNINNNKPEILAILLINRLDLLNNKNKFRDIINLIDYNQPLELSIMESLRRLK